MLEGYAEYYSAELSQKIHRGQKENALKCRNNGGNIPLGYVVGPEGVLVVDPLTAPLVQEIFTMYDEGKTIRQRLSYPRASAPPRSLSLLHSI